MLETLVLSRIQFALNISFHILFPSITIAMCWLLFYFKLRFNFSQNPLWMRVYRFWVKIFALTFAIGVVSGITMSFQFGTNWPGFMETVGNVAGPLLGYEVLTAFFLEATFLSVMLFGINRVPNWLHTLATLFVAVGTSLSAFWIIALDSWMQTPQGHEIIDGVVYPVSWWQIIFNPSMPYRLVHMLLASGLTAAFLVAGVSAYRVLKGDTKQAPKKAMQTAVAIAALLIPLQIFMGDLHGLNTFEHQPQKVAAMEGVWETEKGAPLLLFAWPDEEQRTNHFEVPIPKLASLILTHHPDGEIRGLNEFENAHPPVKPVFFSFRVMVGMGVLMALVAFSGLVFMVRKRDFPRWYMRTLLAMTFSGWVATLAGWYVTEVGRQPFIVQGILRTEDAVTQIANGNVIFTLIAYSLVYGALLAAYIHTVFVMARRAIEVEEFETPDMQAKKQKNWGFSLFGGAA